jgi:hypothetical protein
VSKVESVCRLGGTGEYRIEEYGRTGPEPERKRNVIWIHSALASSLVCRMSSPVVAPITGFLPFCFIFDRISFLLVHDISPTESWKKRNLIIFGSRTDSCTTD